MVKVFTDNVQAVLNACGFVANMPCKRFDLLLCRALSYVQDARKRKAGETRHEGTQDLMAHQCNQSMEIGDCSSTSWAFLALITFGYIAGIAAKFVGGTVNWILAVYVINLLALAVNWIVFFRNRVLDAKRSTN